MANTKRTAEQAYEQSIALARDLINRLEAVVDNMPVPDSDDKINWCHVGDLNETNARLIEILSFIGG